MQQLALHPSQSTSNFRHKHYIGSAHTFEVVNQDPLRPDIAVLKTFFIDDTVNANDWQATWEGLKQDAEDLIGTPLVLQEDLEHPKFSVQQMYDRGTIFDYDIDEANHKIIVYVRITDPSIIARIQSGELEYVSPAVIPRGSEYMTTIGGVDVLTRTLPLHLAIVGNPAYGMQKAKMSHLCTGDGKECYHRLKMMKVANSIFHTADAAKDCVSRQMEIMRKEKKSLSDAQIGILAYSKCMANPNLAGEMQVQKIVRREHELLDKGIPEKEVHKMLEKEFGANWGDYIDSLSQIRSVKKQVEKRASPNSGIDSHLTQTPFIKKMIASASRLESILSKAKSGSKYHMHNGKEGHWIKAKGMDVFVARNQSIKSALLDQCGCTKLGTAGKISKQKANYHKTDSEIKNCHSCRFFKEKENYCEVVEGNIEPYYVSDLWQPKK